MEKHPIHKLNDMKLPFEKVLVTGGAGFIGSNLVNKLHELGVRAFVVDNLKSGRASNLNAIRKSSHLFNKIDINNLPQLDQVFEMFKPEVVFHLAAIPGVSVSVEQPLETNATNVQGTLNVLECATKWGAKRVVFSSSSSIYGGIAHLPTKEYRENSNPRSPYALQKLIGEQYCQMYSKFYKIDTACLRYFNVTGRNQYGGPYGAVISSFCKALRDKERPVVYGDGEQFRDFCAVENVIYANLLAASYDDELKGAEFNVGCGGKTSVNDLWKMIGTKEPTYEEQRAGDVRCSQADISKAERILGYDIVMPFEESIRDTIDWYLNEAEE